MELKSWIFCRYGSSTAIIHPKTNPNIDKLTFKCTHCNKTDPTSLDIHSKQRLLDSKKTSIATVAEIKTEANVAEKASALVAATDHGANGNTTPVIGEGSLTLTDTLNLDSVLVVPSLDYNLLMTWLCLMKTKDEVNLLFQKFHKMIETQYNAKVRALRSDNGGEYQSSDLQKVVRASLIAAKTPISYWGEVIISAAYLINRGEYHKEIQTLDYDYHISEKNESGQSELVNQEAGNKPVGRRWIYTVKYKADDSIERFKARLVAKGYTQIYGIDYTETFAPVVKINIVRVLLMHGVRKAMSEGVQIEEVIVWVEAIPESMVWKETGMLGCQAVNTPIEEGLKLCVEPNQVSTDKGRYQRLVGRLMYLAHTRPDLAYNAPGKGILFAKNVNHQSIEVYTDADWAGAVDDRRSTSGYFTFVGGNLVTWKSKNRMSSLVQV
ncbi:Retrovirus-related Pol polyprotein from transposon RE2 [Vitis vinifera]|uniref:Retrovirus-related Pol polyprotein from transposon RE2 n=1 Tax=Vitis vinifera TaxID=29760 RepID=A0A438E1C2_VITVI|nr:Retrovirus-related Pol polyprotein from transposon RE2 [Vitis vinifera]